jgi:hypothetical protein
MTDGNGEARGTNSFDKQVAQSFVDRLLNLHGELDKLRSEHMLAAKEVRGDMKEVAQEAADAGIGKKALKGFIKKALLERKIDAIPNGMDEQDEMDYDKLIQALGEDYAALPLGQAALAKVEQPAAA